MDESKMANPMLITKVIIHKSRGEVFLVEQDTIEHCKYLNARSECNDIVISVYSHYPLDPNAKSSDTKCVSLSIR